MRAHHESRHYTVLGLIGRGGQGNVYHARLEGPGGFRKDVALKLLKEGLTEESLQRFRDEARILGLARDRSIITVDPPTRLGRHWAIVMELVEGASLNTVLSVGPLPASVALEVVAEIARVLEKVWDARGPEGPLHLLHRDIKPGNIQVTGEGEVKLLDFGVARADFEERESHTVQHIGGTVGFIAPERTRGINGPECDVYSLGVTLRVLLTAERATEIGPLELPAGVTAGIEGALALAEAMRAEDPAARPTMREVQERARAVRRRADGPSLAEWASTAIPLQRRTFPDPLVGSVLTESLTVGGSLGSELETLQPIRRSRRTGLVGWGIALLAIAGIAPLAAMAVVLLVAGSQWTSASAPEVAPDAPDPDRSSAAETTPAPDPPPEAIADEAAPTPADEGVPPTPVIAPRPVAPLPATAPLAFAGVDVTSSIPAELWLDGVRIGRTPLSDLRVPVGSHRLLLRADDGRTVDATVLVGGRRGATRFSWDGGPRVGAR